MKADDIADLQPLNPCTALRLPTERRVVRLNKMVAGNIGLPQERPPSIELRRVRRVDGLRETPAIGHK